MSLPIIIAITALCRLIVLHSKEADPWVLIAEAGAIPILAGALYLMSYKDKLSLEKEKLEMNKDLTAPQNDYAVFLPTKRFLCYVYRKATF